MTEQLIKEKLALLRQNKTAREEACGSIELRLQEIQEELRQAALPFEQQRETIEAEIKTLMLEVAHTIKTIDGAANFRSGGMRVSYDYKALDSLCASREEIKAAILPFRKETLAKPTISVEVY